MESIAIEFLRNTEQPNPHYAMTGFNVVPIKLESPIICNHATRGTIKIAYAVGYDITGEPRFGYYSGPNFKFYQTDVLSDLVDKCK